MMKKVIFIIICIFVCFTLFAEDVIYILPTGEVGIGEDTPVEDIEVEGNVKVTDEVILSGSENKYDCTRIVEEYNLSGATQTQTLPNASGFLGKIIVMWRNGNPEEGYKLNFDVTEGVQKIGGLNDTVWKGQGTGKMILFSDGTEWQVEYYLDSGVYTGRGRFIKYQDGYMEQWGKPTNVSSPEMFYYPLAFTTGPAVTVSAPETLYYTTNGNSAINPYSDRFTFYCIHVTTGDDISSTTCHWHARGKWY